MRDRLTRGLRSDRNYHHHHHDYQNEYRDYHRIFARLCFRRQRAVSYRYGETITYVTRSGKTLTDDEVRTRVKVGIPVNVRFSTEGEDRIIDRIEIDDD